MLGEQATGRPARRRSQPVAEPRGACAPRSTAAKALYVEESLNRYVVALLRHTRADGRLYLGAQPARGIAIMRVAKARALLDGRDYVIPDDVKAVAAPVLAHRADPRARRRARPGRHGGRDRDATPSLHTPVPV